MNGTFNLTSNQGMNPNYSIEIDPSRQLIKLRLAGQWELTTLVTYKHDLGGTPGEYLVFVDLREHGLQSQEVATALQTLIENLARMVRKRAILMSGSALHAMQIRRISPNSPTNSFQTPDEAMAWLFS